MALVYLQPTDFELNHISSTPDNKQIMLSDQTSQSMLSSKSEPRTAFAHLHDSQSTHTLQTQSYMSPSAQLRANFTPHTGDLWHHIYVVLVACMTDSHAYSYLHMACQNEACLLAADCVERMRQFITDCSQSGPAEP